MKINLFANTPTPDLRRQIETLRESLADARACSARAQKWHDAQGTRASGENLREALSEQALYEGRLRRAEAELSARADGEGVAA